MSDKPLRASLVRKFGQRLRGIFAGRLRNRFLVGTIGLIAIATGTAIADVYLRNLFPFINFTGFSGTYSSAGSVDLSGPFFQSLGTNGRTCGTCHQPNNAFGLSAIDAQL